MDENSCPKFLRPKLVNKELKCTNRNYPDFFLTMEGNACCTRKQFKLMTNGEFPVLNIEDYKNIHTFMHENNINCPDKFCNTHGSKAEIAFTQGLYFSDGDPCEDENNIIKPIELAIETFNRGIFLTKNVCKDLENELPSQNWLNKQRNYFNTLSETEQNYLKFYGTGAGYSLLNSFIRNGFQLIFTKGNKKSLKENNPYFIETFNTFTKNGGKDYHNYFIHYYNSIQKCILNSPVLDKDIVLYRGQNGDDFFKGLKNNLYQNIGIMSCTPRSYIAARFAVSHNLFIEGTPFISRIIIPKGYRCLLNFDNEHTKYIYLFEFILPDNTLFYVNKFDSDKQYIDKLNKNTIPLNIKTNEIILINEKSIEPFVLYKSIQLIKNYEKPKGLGLNQNFINPENENKNVLYYKKIIEQASKEKIILDIDSAIVNIVYDIVNKEEKKENVNDLKKVFDFLMSLENNVPKKKRQENFNNALFALVISNTLSNKGYLAITGYANKENIGIYVHAIRQALKNKTIYSPQSFSNKIVVN